MDSVGAKDRAEAGSPPGGEAGSETRAGVRAYVGVLAAFAVALVASSAYSHGVALEPRFALGAAALAGILLLADALPVRVNERHEVNAVDIGLLIGVAVLGPFWAAVAALPLAVLPARRDPLRATYEAGCVTAEVYLAGAAFSLVSGPLLSGDATGPAAPVVYGTLLAGATMVGANHAANAILLRVKYCMSARELWEELAGPYLPAHALNVLTAGLGVLALISYGPAAAIVLVAGSVGSQALVLRSREHARRSRELEAENASLKRSLSGAGATFGSLVAEALGRKDGRADRRAAATAVYAADLAREMKLGEERAEEVRLAGILLDIGMVFLPEGLLLADGSPNSVARKELDRHPALGEAALASVPGYEEVARWVRWHHERSDGRGYPDKLRGPWIPTEAKILAVAQAYAGLVIDGPRRPGVSHREAREHLVKGMDAEFDEGVVKAFLRILDTESEGYRLADDDRFVLPGQPGPRGATEAPQTPGGNAASPRS